MKSVSLSQNQGVSRVALALHILRENGALPLPDALVATDIPWLVATSLESLPLQRSGNTSSTHGRTEGHVGLSNQLAHGGCLLVGLSLLWGTEGGPQQQS